MVDKITAECPKCKKGTMVLARVPAHRECKVSRGSGQNSSQSSWKDNEYTVLTGCTNCKSKRYY
jgi:hypothetical protein